jgi:hypothetical protein
MSTVTFEEFLAGAEVVSVDPPSIPEVPVDAEVSFQVYDEGTRRRIERRGGGLLGETSVRIVENEMVITEGILPRLSDIQPPENGYKEKGQYVTDFTVRMPKAMDGPNHVADLCICLHSRMAHHFDPGGTCWSGSQMGLGGDRYGRLQRHEAGRQAVHLRRDEPGSPPCQQARLSAWPEGAAPSRE